MARGEGEKVRASCETDTLNLYVAYIRWALLTGRTDPAGHNASIDSLVDCLSRERSTRPHLGEFLDLVSRGHDGPWNGASASRRHPDNRSPIPGPAG